MLNCSGIIIKETAVAPSQILFNVQNQMSVRVIVDKTVGTAGEDGRKIVKAGTPLNGDLTARGTAFVAAKGTANPAVGVLLHDVDVTDGNANGTLLIWGFVNLNRMDSTTANSITTDIKTALAGRVWFLKD